MRERVLAVVLSACVIAGCGGNERQPPANTVKETLRGFYAAVLREQDFQAACRYTAPDFYLRPSSIVGVNINADNPTDETHKLPKPQTAPRRGPCAELAARVYAKRGDEYPWPEWSVESMKVSKDGQTAQAVTRDGTAGLRVVDGEWRLLWVFDSP